MALFKFLATSTWTRVISTDAGSIHSICLLDEIYSSHGRMTIGKDRFIVNVCDSKITFTNQIHSN